MKKTFVDRPKTLEFAKVFFLENEGEDVYITKQIYMHGVLLLVEGYGSLGGGRERVGKESGIWFL